MAQEGKKPEGPPDLEQAWRDFNQRLNRLFGQRAGGDGGGGGAPSNMKGAGLTISVIAAVIVLIWLASGIYMVREGQAAVITTFGKYSHTSGTGANWRWPAPIQRHDIVNMGKVRTAEIGYRGSIQAKNLNEALMLTDDENIIDIQFAVQYTVADPYKWLFNNRETDETIRQVAETAIREMVGRSKMDYVLYEGREKVAFDTRALMQEIVNRYNLGANIANVTMQAVQPPEQVQGAFDDAVKAGQDRARARNEGEAYANDVIPRARGNAFRLLEEAEAYRSMVTENATGNASRFSQVVDAYQKAPAVTRERMYLDTMQDILASASKVLIDAKSGSNLLYLPLDKLVSQTAANDAALRSKSGPVQQTLPIPTDLLQPLEQSRQRDTRGREAARDREIR